MECATVHCDIEDYCTMLNVTRPKARKEHKCHECKRIISTGEKYLSETTLCEGKVETWKTCADCESIRKHLFAEGFYYGEIKFMLREHVRDCSGEMSESILSALTPCARAMVCAMIEEVWEDAFDLED